MIKSHNDKKFVVFSCSSTGLCFSFIEHEGGGLSLGDGTSAVRSLNAYIDLAAKQLTKCKAILKQMVDAHEAIGRVNQILPSASKKAEEEFTAVRKETIDNAQAGIKQDEATLTEAHQLLEWAKKYDADKVTSEDKQAEASKEAIRKNLESQDRLSEELDNLLGDARGKGIQIQLGCGDPDCAECGGEAVKVFGGETPKAETPEVETPEVDPFKGLPADLPEELKAMIKELHAEGTRFRVIKLSDLGLPRGGDSDGIGGLKASLKDLQDKLNEAGVSGRFTGRFS